MNSGLRLTCDNDMLLSKRLSTLSIQEPEYIAHARRDGTNISKSGSNRERSSKSRKSGKILSSKKKGKRSESCPLLDKNHETISYRIYGNPNGVGFLIEARMFKSKDGRHDKRRRQADTREVTYIEYVNKDASKK